MEIIEILENFNEFLEQSYLFRAFKFLLGFYLIVMFLTLLGVLFRIGKPYYTVLMTGSGYKLSPGKFQKKWNKVRERVAGDNPSEWKAAVLEAGQMLNEVLKIIGYEGDNLGQKLVNMLPEHLDNLEDVKKANEVKNKIAKDESYELSREEAREVVDVFGEALSFFEAVDDTAWE
ncbi:MAG: hypothetical protein R6V40_03970 [Candidatus Moraniibacteriota bacterium]